MKTPNTSFARLPITLAILFSGLLALSALAGCGGNGESSRTAADEKGEEELERERPSAGAGEREDELPPAEAPDERGDW